MRRNTIGNPSHFLVFFPRIPICFLFPGRSLVLAWFRWHCSRPHPAPTFVVRKNLELHGCTARRLEGRGS